MNEDCTPNNGDNLNGFALMRKPSSAVEKAAPGAKRILFGMVADTLDLAKKAASKEIEVADTQSENWFETGLNYYFGQGVPQDYAEAVEWFRKAAERGFAKAEYALGICCQDGKGVPVNDVDAAKWLALAWHRKAAEQNVAHDQCMMGRFYYYGYGVPRDYAEAVKWIRKAAEQEYAWAQYQLGCCYSDGNGVPPEYAEAMKWYRKAAEQGNAAAQNSLGDCLAFGPPQYYKDSLGDLYASEDPQYHTGAMRDEAVVWYRKAAEQGNAEAQNSLGDYYEQGQRVPQDVVEAYKFYKLAAEQNQELAVLNVKRIVRQMTAVEIAEGERRYREVRPKKI